MLKMKDFLNEEFNSVDRIKGGYLPPEYWTRNEQVSHDMMNFHEWSEEHWNPIYGNGTSASEEGGEYWITD